mmetsp:Transcript_22465/g.36355  ORF Transcript_22465/g.36355 Transcript_22465/m.36355 type:complete len:446 (-) Transcript_22465:1819-3156(-)
MLDAPILPDGWDMALHLTEDAVQALIRADWDKASGGAMARAITWTAPGTDDGQVAVIDLETDLGLPVVQLDVASQSAALAFDLSNGVVRVGMADPKALATVPSVRALEAEGAVAWEHSIDITPQSGLRLVGHVPLGVRRSDEDLANGFVIALETASATLALTGDGSEDITGLFGSDEVAPWAVDQGLGAQIVSIADTDGSYVGGVSLAKLATRVVAGRTGVPLLQVLGATNPDAGDADIAVPAPQSEDYDYSLTVSSKAAMSMIANSYNVGTGEVKLDTEQPQEGLPHWFVQVREPMVFEGAFGIEGGETLHTDHSELFMRFGGSVDQGVKLSTYIDPNSTVELELELAAHFPLSITGSGATQMVGLCNGAQSVEGTGFYEQLVVPQLTSFLTGDIRTDMTQVQLRPLSQFALKELQLAGHRLDFALAALPGELVVMGKLEALAE